MRKHDPKRQSVVVSGEWREETAPRSGICRALRGHRGRSTPLTGTVGPSLRLHLASPPPVAPRAHKTQCLVHSSELVEREPVGTGYAALRAATCGAKRISGMLATNNSSLNSAFKGELIHARA